MEDNFKIISILITGFLLLPVFVFGAVGYTRTPSGYTISNPITFDILGVLDEYPTFLSWRLGYFVGDDSPPTYVSQCFTTNNGSAVEFLALGEYTRVSLYGSEAYADCFGDIWTIDLEGDRNAPTPYPPIFEVVEGEPAEPATSTPLFTLPSSAVASSTGWITDLFDTFWVLIALVIGIPLAFVVIKRIIKIMPKR